MTATSTKTQRTPGRVLRLAVITDERVCAELHQTKPGGLTVGSDYRADLLVVGSHAPTMFPLFEVRQGTYYLNVPPGTRGKIRLGRKAMTIGQLHKRFGRGDALRLKLNARAKGKLQIGMSTLMFQFDRPKPVPPRIPFPAIFRASLFATIGSLFLYSQLASMGLLGPLFVWASVAPYPEGIDFEDRMMAIASLPRRPKPPKPPAPPPEEQPENEDTKKVPKPKKPVDTPKVQPTRPSVMPKLPKEYSEEAVAEARGVGVARVLGTYGGKGPGTVFDRVAEGENNLDALFAQGMTATTLSDGGKPGVFVPGAKGVEASGTAVTTEGFETGDGPALTNKATKEERKVVAKVTSRTSAISGGGDADVIKKTLRHHIRGLESCYTNVLRSDASLGTGKHTYTIVVNVMGRVTRVTIEEDTLRSPKVAACAKSRIKGWRFRLKGAEDDSEITFSAVYSAR